MEDDKQRQIWRAQFRAVSVKSAWLKYHAGQPVNENFVIEGQGDHWRISDKAGRIVANVFDDGHYCVYLEDGHGHLDYFQDKDILASLEKSKEDCHTKIMSSIREVYEQQVASESNEIAEGEALLAKSIPVAEDEANRRMMHEPYRKAAEEAFRKSWKGRLCVILFWTVFVGVVSGFLVLVYCLLKDACII